MARVVELEVIKGLPVSPVRPVAVDKPPPPAPADAKPAVVVNRGLPGPGVLPAPALAILCPGALSFKAIVAAAVSAAQCA